MPDTNCKLELGMRVQDKVTGAIGTVTAKAEYLYGTPQYLFEYRNDAGSICSSWFEYERFSVLDKEEK